MYSRAEADCVILVVMKDFVFVSGNKNKVHWLQVFLGQPVQHHALDLTEIQSLNSLAVVEHKAREAYKILKKPVLIEDTSVVFTVLGSLPGPFIKFFLEELGNEGICALLNSYDDRSAEAVVMFGYYDGVSLQTFEGRVRGRISDIPKGTESFGWNPIFIPDGATKTYAEMDEAEFTERSARNIAVQRMKPYLL